MLLITTIASIDFIINNDTIPAGLGIFSCLCFDILIVFFDILDIRNYHLQKAKQQRDLEDE